MVVVGFDPETRALGGIASHESASGIALGPVIGTGIQAQALRRTPKARERMRSGIG